MNQIQRPMIQRRNGGMSGRVEHDARGNAVWKRTRATDGELTVHPSLGLIDSASSQLDDLDKRVRSLSRHAVVAAKSQQLAHR